MKGDIALRIAKFSRLTRGDSLEATEKFLSKNSDLVGFLDERGDAEIISRYGNKANFADESIERNQKYTKLIMGGIPKNIACLMRKNPDFIDIPFNQAVRHYHHLVKGGVSETAAAIIASTDYINKESKVLEEITNNYHITKSSEIPLELPFYAVRYRRIFESVDKENYREISLAFHTIDNFNQGYDQEVA